MHYAPTLITANITEPVPVILYSREVGGEARQVMRNLKRRGIRAKAIQIASAAQLVRAMQRQGARGAVFYLALRGKGGRVELPGKGRKKVNLSELLALFGRNLLRGKHLYLMTDELMTKPYQAKKLMKQYGLKTLSGYSGKRMSILTRLLDSAVFRYLSKGSGFSTTLRQLAALTGLVVLKNGQSQYRLSSAQMGVDSFLNRRNALETKMVYF